MAGLACCAPRAALACTAETCNVAYPGLVGPLPRNGAIWVATDATDGGGPSPIVEVTSDGEAVDVVAVQVTAGPFHAMNRVEAPWALERVYKVNVALACGGSTSLEFGIGEDDSTPPAAPHVLDAHRICLKYSASCDPQDSLQITLEAPPNDAALLDIEYGRDEHLADAEEILVSAASTPSVGAADGEIAVLIGDEGYEMWNGSIENGRYYARARYLDLAGNASEWTSTTTFDACHRGCSTGSIPHALGWAPWFGVVLTLCRRSKIGA